MGFARCISHYLVSPPPSRLKIFLTSQESMPKAWLQHAFWACQRFHSLDPWGLHPNSQYIVYPSEPLIFYPSKPLIFYSSEPLIFYLSKPLIFYSSEPLIFFVPVSYT